MEGIGNYTGETGKNGSLEGGFFSRMAKKVLFCTYVSLCN